MVNSMLPRLQMECHGLEQLDEVARRIISFGKEYKVWAFEGEMGAGKTTLIKAICKAFKVGDNVNSPTFSIVNEYINDGGETFYHFDFYRIKDEEEAMDIGAEEYFYSDHYCFIEWPSKVMRILPDKILKIELNIVDSNKRLVDIVRND